MTIFIFFFSSRRRHTIWNCDWSSDVCSSDLIAEQTAAAPLQARTRTAYASGDMLAAQASVTMSDAAPGAQSENARSEAESPAATADPSEPAKSESGVTAAKHGEMTSADDKPADAAKLEAAANESVKAEGKPEETI